MGIFCGNIPPIRRVRDPRGSLREIFSNPTVPSGNLCERLLTSMYGWVVLSSADML